MTFKASLQERGLMVGLGIRSSRPQFTTGLLMCLIVLYLCEGMTSAALKTTCSGFSGKSH